MPLQSRQLESDKESVVLRCGGLPALLPMELKRMITKLSYVESIAEWSFDVLRGHTDVTQHPSEHEGWFPGERGIHSLLHQNSRDPRVWELFRSTTIILDRRWFASEQASHEFAAAAARHNVKMQIIMSDQAFIMARSLPPMIAECILGLYCPRDADVDIYEAEDLVLSGLRSFTNLCPNFQWCPEIRKLMGSLTDLNVSVSQESVPDLIDALRPLLHLEVLRLSVQQGREIGLPRRLTGPQSRLPRLRVLETSGSVVPEVITTIYGPLLMDLTISTYFDWGVEEVANVGKVLGQLNRLNSLAIRCPSSETTFKLLEAFESCRPQKIAWLTPIETLGTLAKIRMLLGLFAHADHIILVLTTTMANILESKPATHHAILNCIRRVSRDHENFDRSVGGVDSAVSRIVSKERHELGSSAGRVDFIRSDTSPYSPQLDAFTHLKYALGNTWPWPQLDGCEDLRKEVILNQWELLRRDFTATEIDAETELLGTEVEQGWPRLANHEWVGDLWEGEQAAWTIQTSNFVWPDQ